MKQIAIMGGTFNPIHIGHLLAAQSVFETGQFDEVWFMPSGKPPHKDSSVLVDNHHRLAMCQLAIKDYDGFRVSDFELTRDGLIYSVDTFDLLAKAHSDTRFHLVIGTDSVLTLNKWYNFEKLMAIGSFIVVERGGYDVSAIDEVINNYYNHYGTKFTEVKMPQVEISSSDIRSRVKTGQSIVYRVPKSVKNYIDEHGLYLEA